jgi:DeoR/GlpR family transcriptional regulator of sugar metabolism
VDDVHQNHGKLLTDQRRKKIVEMIQRQDTITTDDLISHFGVSPMTVWRDLAVLEENHQLKRIRGGAVRVDAAAFVEPLFSNKRPVNRTKKSAIARYTATNFVHDNDIIILEAGTTVAMMVRHLTQRNLTVITHGLATLNELAPRLPDTNIMTCGGMLRDVSLTFVGPQAIQYFENIRVNTFFVSATGITPEDGLTDPNLLEIQVKQAMASSATRIVALMDSTKFGIRSFSQLLKPDAIDVLVTDTGAPLPDVEQLQSLGIEVHIVR